MWLDCRGLGGLEAWGLAIDSLQLVNIAAAEESNGEDGEQLEPMAAADEAAPSPQPNAEILTKLE